MLSLAWVAARTVLPSPSTGTGPTLNILFNGQKMPSGYLSVRWWTFPHFHSDCSPVPKTASSSFTPSSIEWRRTSSKDPRPGGSQNSSPVSSMFSTARSTVVQLVTYSLKSELPMRCVKTISRRCFQE